MNFYERMQQTANKMLKGKGQSLTLTRQTAGAYNTSLGAATVTTTTQAAYGAVFEYGYENIDGTLIKAGDKQLLLSALNTSGASLTAPALNDTVTIGGVVYTITQIKPMSPAGTVVMYDCNLRGI